MQRPKSLSDAVIDHLEALYKADPGLFVKNFVDPMSKYRIFYGVRNSESAIADIEPYITSDLREKCVSRLAKPDEATLSLEYVSFIKVTAADLFSEIQINPRWERFWNNVKEKSLHTKEQQDKCEQRIACMFMYKVLDSIGVDAKARNILDPISNRKRILISKILHTANTDINAYRAIKDLYIKSIKNMLPIENLSKYMLTSSEEDEKKFNTAITHWTSTLNSLSENNEYKLLGERGDIVLLDWLNFALNAFNNHIKRNKNSLNKIAIMILDFIKDKYLNKFEDQPIIKEKIRGVIEIALDISKTDTNKKYKYMLQAENSPRKIEKSGTLGTIMRKLSISRTTSAPSVATAKINESPRAPAAAAPLPRYASETKSNTSPRTVSAATGIRSIATSSPAAVETERKSKFNTTKSIPLNDSAKSTDEKKKINKEKRKSLNFDWMQQTSTSTLGKSESKKINRLSLRATSPDVSKEDADVADKGNEHIPRSSRKRI